MISVGRILEGAFGVFRDHLTAVAVWGGIYFAGNIATIFAMQPMAQGALSPNAADPAQLMSAMGPVWLLSFLLGIVGVVLYTASMRTVLRPDAGGIAFLRLGMDELRMLGLLLLFCIVAFVPIFAAGLVVGLFISSIDAGSGSMALAATFSGLVALVVFGALLFLIIRFSLAFPLTLHRGAFAIGEAWTRSRGHFWTLFGAALVVSVIAFVASMAVNMVAAGSYFADILAAAGDPEATARAAEQQATNLNGFSTLTILQSIGGAVVAAIWVGLSGGSAAVAARLLLKDEFDDAENVFG